GAARVYAKYPPQQDVVLAFQPGEESDRGALSTLQHANLDLTASTEAFAIHVNAAFPAHSISYRRGVFMASGDWFHVEFIGSGGHASAPELVGNPITAGANYVRWLTEFADVLSEEEESVVATVT